MYVTGYCISLSQKNDFPQYDCSHTSHTSFMALSFDPYLAPLQELLCSLITQKRQNGSRIKPTFIDSRTYFIKSIYKSQIAQVIQVILLMGSCAGMILLKRQMSVGKSFQQKASSSIRQPQRQRVSPVRNSQIQQVRSVTKVEDLIGQCFDRFDQNKDGVLEDEQVTAFLYQISDNMEDRFQYASRLMNDFKEKKNISHRKGITKAQFLEFYQSM